MKVTFIFTPEQMVNKCFYTASIWKNYSKNAILVPPLGMVYLAALLRDKGYDASFIDANILQMSKEDIIRKLNEIKRDYLHQVTDEELDKYLEQGYRKFYYRSRFIWQKLLQVNSFREFRRLASGALSLLGSRD